MRERWRLLQLLQYAGIWPGAALVGWNTVASATPASLALATGWLVDSATRTATGADVLSSLAAPLAVVVILLMLTQLAESGQDIACIAAGRRIDGSVRRRVRDLISRPPGIAHLDDPSVQDDVTRAADLGRQHGRHRSPGNAAAGQTLLVFRLLSALSAATVIAAFSPILALFVLVACLTMRAIVRRQWMYLADIADQATTGERHMAYWTQLITGPAAGKEIRVFGLGRWLVGLRQAAALAAWQPIWRERRGVMRRQTTIVLLSFAAALAALGAPGYAAATGRITPAQLATCLVAAWAVFDIGNMGFEAFDIEYGRGSVRALDRIVTRYAATPPPSPYRVDHSDRAPHVVFADVSFRYPGTTTDVLDALALDVRPGQVLAIVGPNGVGKTTLTKLLAGLYQPTGGRICVDGMPLCAYEIEPWRRRMATLFQDFTRYPLSVRENVAAAAPEAIADTAGIRRALAAAGANSIVAGLPDGLETLLWRSGTGGVDLSGGQWQKIAIARVLFAAEHGRRMLVLDEPTSHLDVTAEAEFFDTVMAATRGASVILVSHRLATVRNADRIVVLSGGRITESGTHDELLASGGEYAHLFRLQAARFTEAAISS